MKKKKQPWQTCNVVRESETERRLWQFRPRGNGCVMTREYAAVGSQRLPAKASAKDFQTLFKQSLNVAWLPPGEVFLSIVVLPTKDLSEIKDMLDLQLEKLSPLPAAQTSWTYIPLPGRDESQTRVLLIVIPRHVVTSFLGRLESEGYLADRLDLPQIDELLASIDQGDGIWVFPRKIKDRSLALVAWIIDGEVQHVGLTFLPEENWQAVFKSQFAQVVWAGELDGWLKATPEAHLVAEGDLAADFEPVLRELTSKPVDLRPPHSEQELAQRTADRCKDSQTVPLLPPEYATRYRQVFVDRIWMRSLGTVVLVYLFGVLGYFAAIQWASQQKDSVQSTRNSLAQTYTNTLELVQRVNILKDQMNLKYAALDSFKTVAEKLPEGMTLSSFGFQRGSKVLLFGTAPQNEPAKITAYVAALQAATTGSNRLFKTVSSPSIRVDPGKAQNRWEFNLELANPENEQ